MTKLKIDNVSKVYRIYDAPKDRLIELLFGKKRHKEHCALSNINLDIKAGEAIGVIGNNGAGKSTLLKIITGTVRPTKGKVSYQGRLTAILELGTGFHPDFSGKDNIYYSAALMDIPRSEISARFNEIVEFSELGDAVYQPIKTYSTGMVVRLAFSLVTLLDPEILIIDEALAVGDRNFQKKCLERMLEIKNSGTTILFCSHSMHHIMQFCDRALWLDDGVVKSIGNVKDVVDKYIHENSKDVMVEAHRTNDELKVDLHCIIDRLDIMPGETFKRGEALYLSLSFTILKSDKYVLGVAIDRKDTDLRLMAETSLENGISAIDLKPGEYSVKMKVSTDVLRAGSYRLYTGLLHESLLKIEDLKEVEIKIEDFDDIKSPSLIRGEIEWDLNGDLFGQ